MPTTTDQPVVHTLVSTSQYTVLAGAALLMGMSTAAFTKAGKGKNAGAKTGFALTGLFLLAGVGMLTYVGIKIISTHKEEKSP